MLRETIKSKVDLPPTMAYLKWAKCLVQTKLSESSNLTDLTWMFRIIFQLVYQKELQILKWIQQRASSSVKIVQIKPNLTRMNIQVDSSPMEQILHTFQCELSSHFTCCFWMISILRRSLRVSLPRVMATTLAIGSRNSQYKAYS